MCEINVFFTVINVFSFLGLVRHYCIGIYYQEELCMILKTGDESSCEL